MDAVGAPFGKGAARFALAARLHIGCGREAIDGFGKDTCAGGFAYASGTAEEVGMRQLFANDRVFKRGGNVILPQNGVKTLWPILSGRYNKMFHNRQI